MKNNQDLGFARLKEALDGISVTQSGAENLSVEKGLELAVSKISSVKKNKLMFIGNGASASIASHMATDFWKNGGIPAIAFNDCSLLTAISNDIGYEHVFEKPIEFFGTSSDVLVAISSSGQSENILRAATAAYAKGIYVITLSGFKNDNPLRKLGGLNFYVPSYSYGMVEVAHHAICHYLVDSICKKNQSSTNLKTIDALGGKKQNKIPITS